MLGPRTKTSGCKRGELPDRRCSPGAYYSKLTEAVICSPRFSTSTIRDVPQSEKFVVEREYGKAATYYGRSVEIDHIVPLELGGSNSIANLYFEPGSGKANYHAKDRLENKLHDMVCSGSITLRKAQRQIATNWKTLYKKVYGRAPEGGRRRLGTRTLHPRYPAAQPLPKVGIRMTQPGQAELILALPRWPAWASFSGA